MNANVRSAQRCGAGVYTHGFFLGAGRVVLRLIKRKASGPTGGDAFSHYHPGFFIYLFIYLCSLQECTHRRRGVPDRVARRLPYLGRATRFQQVLGESPARFGCHLLIRLLQLASCSRQTRALRAPVSPAPSLGDLFTHTGARAHTPSLYARSGARGVPEMTVAN